MRLWIGLGVFLGVLLLAFVIFVLRITETPAPAEPAAPTTAPITDVQATDTYHAGVHTVHGTATVPTACTTLTASSSVSTASTTQVVRVDLSAAPDQGICLQLPTPMTFSVSAEAASDAEVDVYANGSFATTTP